MDKITLDIAVNNTESIKSLKDIKDAVKLLKSEALNIGEGGPGFTQLTEKAGQLQDKLNDVNDTIRVLSGNSIENFNKSFTNLASTAVGAFGAIEGAQALFGEQSEELQKTLVKLQALMNLSNGIREFANIGQAAQDFKVVLSTLIPTLFTQTAATEGAAVAQVQLNLAMLANPVGILVAATLALVAALVLFTDSAESAEEKERRLGEEFRKHNKQIDDQIDLYQRLQDIRNTTGQFAIDLAKAQGKSESELYQLRKKLIEDNIANNLKQQAFKIDADAELIEAETKLRGELYILNAQYITDTEKVNKKAQEDAQKRAQEDKDKKIKAEQDLIKAIESEYNAENEKDVKRGEDELNRIKKENAEKLRLEQEFNDANRELTKQINDDADNDIKVISELKLARNQNDVAAQIKYLEEQRDIELQNVELTSNERLLIEQRTANEIARIEKSVNDAKIDAVQNGFTTIGNLAELFAGKSKKQQEVAFKIQKGAAIANAIIDTYKAANAAYASLAGIPVVGPVLGGVAAGVAVTAGLLNVKQIKEQKFDAGGSGASPAISSPSFGGGSGGNSSSQNTVSNGQFYNVGDFKPGEDVEKRVYVVEADITGVQRKVQVIENRATY